MCDRTFLKQDEAVNAVLNDYSCILLFCRSGMKGGGSDLKYKPLNCEEFIVEGICELPAVSIKFGETSLLKSLILVGYFHCWLLFS